MVVPPTSSRRTPLAAAVAVLLAAAVPASGQTLVYDNATLAALVAGPDGLRASDDVLRPRTVTDEELLGLDAAGMAARLRRAIDRAGGPGETPHVVAVDEVGNAFRDPAPRTRFKTVSVGPSTFRIASHNRIVSTGDGWRLVRNPPTPDVPGPDHAGVRLSTALAILADTPAPWGGTYAERVHLLIAPAMVTAIGAGRGPHFTLDRSGGRAIRAAWRGVMPALARSGAVWLQMYHGGRRALPALQWRRAPKRIADYVARHGGQRARVHLLFTSVDRRPRGAKGCADAMACQWSLARSSSGTRAIVANGVGAYRLDSDARAWLKGLRAAQRGG